jgi:ribosomal protein L11 methyltransferase
MRSITRAATSFRQEEPGGTIAVKPGSASGAVIAAKAPGAPTVAANLLRPLLLAVARAGFAGAPPQMLVASGLLRHEADEVAAAFESHGLREAARRETAEWAALLLSVA